MIIGLRKKGFNFFIVFLLLLVALPVYATARPKWTDFCPRGLENSEYKEIQNFWPDGTKSTQAIYNYWAERRASFESYLKSCNALADDASKSACYSELRKSEEQKNDLYKLKRKQLLYENNIELNRR